MRTAKTWTRKVTEILQRKEGELIQAMRNRDDITIGKSANQTDGLDREDRTKSVNEVLANAA